MGLPKAHRLRRREEFNRIYQKGSRFSADCFTLRVLPRFHSGGKASVKPQVSHRNLPTRIGVTIGLKVDKRAVVRNRIRRQIQAVFRYLLPHLSSGRDLLVVVHPKAVQYDYFQFLQKLEQLLINAEVLNGR